MASLALTQWNLVCQLVVSNDEKDRIMDNSRLLKKTLHASK